MTVSILFLVGRFVFAVPFVLVGVDRIVDDEAPGAAKAWAALGLLTTAAVVLGVYGDVAALALAAVIVGMTVGGAEDDERLHLVGLLGGALCIAALYAAVGSAIDFTITEPVLDLDLR